MVAVNTIIVLRSHLLCGVDEFYVHVTVTVDQSHETFLSEYLNKTNKSEPDSVGNTEQQHRNNKMSYLFEVILEQSRNTIFGTNNAKQ